MPSRLLHLAVLASLLPGCKQTDPLYCDPSTPCTDPDRPFCDDNGEYPASDGIKHTCIPDPFGADAGPDTLCVPNEFVECSDLDTAVYCNDDGSAQITLDCGGPCDAAQDGCQCEADTSTCSDNLTVHCDSNGRPEEVEACALGCAETGDRCVDVAPSNDLGAYLDMTDDAPVVVLTDGAIIDTDAGTIENGDGQLVDVPDFQIAAPADGVAVRVFAVKSILFSDAIVVGGRALAIVADSDVVVAGHVRIEAGALTAGTCVGDDAAVCDGPTLTCGGGGGGGFGTNGGEGGGATVGSDSSAGGGRGSFAGSETMAPLRGGCAGGVSKNMNDPPARGGGGIQVVSRTRIILDDSDNAAFLDAGGEGATSMNGGGSGGGILLEAPKVTVPAGTGVVANGGGGGCADDAGDDARLSTSQASGGSCSTTGYGDGGNGASAAGGAENGEAVSRSSGIALGGGGGGGAGRIRANVPAPIEFAHPGIVSPAASVGVLLTR